MFNNWKNKLFGNEFFRNVFTLFTGSVIAQIIVFAATPIITRLYPVEVFGVFVLYSSLVGITSIIATMRYELAIMLPEDETDAANLFFVSLITSLCMSLFVAVLLFLFAPAILNFFQAQKLDVWVYTLPVAIFLSGVNQSFIYWNNRHKMYRQISVAGIYKSTTGSGMQIAFGALRWYNAGLIPGMILGLVATIIYQIKISFKSLNKISKQVSRKKLWEIAHRYKQIPIFTTTTDALNTFSNQLPVLLLGKFYGISMTSFYGLANRIVTTPAGLIGQSVAQVFFQKAVEKNVNKDGLYEFVKKTYFSLFKLYVIPFTVLFFFAPQIFKIVFGDHWTLAGKFTQIMLPWLFVNLINSPLSDLINILHKQRQFIFYPVTLTIVRFFALYAGYFYFNDVFVSVGLFSFTGFVFNLFFMYYLLRISKI